MFMLIFSSIAQSNVHRIYNGLQFDTRNLLSEERFAMRILTFELVLIR